ncbi:MAG: restriction endonuclease [Magnetococcus sp. YQC-3]
MAISSTEAMVIPELAALLYRFLPRSGFENEASKIGVVHCCQGDNKTKAIKNLLEHTLSDKRSLFEPLIVRIVSSGKQYCLKQNDPIRKEEILKLNELVQRVGFRFPDLWDPEFLASLESSPPEPFLSKENSGHPSDPIQEKIDSNFREQLERLKAEFYELYKLENKQKAGFDLEKLLVKLFELYGLASRGSYRVPGEQIDGSFILDNQVYLVEAKWLKEPVSEEPLLVFRGKVEGKSAWTRGLFIALNGFSEQALQSIVQGKQPSFLLMDGHDIVLVLEGHCRLDELLRAKIRCLSEKGKVFVSAREILQDGRVSMGRS